MFRVSTFAAVGMALLIHAGSAAAYPGADTSVATRYPAATNLAVCGTCHVDFTPVDGTLNPYGAAVLANLVVFDFDAAMAAVEGDDSDGDGTSNIDEINADTGFFPGWTCETYTNALNGPVDLVDFVSPVDPGCNGPGTTTTTIGGGTTTTTAVVETTTTTTGPVTTTTVPVGEPSCGDPVEPYDGTVATDCLFILQAAVGSQECADCLCDPIGNNGVNSTDALLCLKVSVGEVLPLDCPACGGTTTTTTGGGTTTTTTGGGTTTTTTAGGTTTTTAGSATTTTTVASGTTTTTTGSATTTSTVIPG